MIVAVTGATGFVGRHLLHQLTTDGHKVRAWFRNEAKQSGLDSLPVEWTRGALNDQSSTEQLLSGVDAVIHTALHRPDGSWNVTGDRLLDWAEVNMIGTLRLISTARKLRVKRFIFVSSCAVHDEILSDRPLDEAHPLWPHSHYGAHKAALEKFVHSFGSGENFPICALRPTGIYGVEHVRTESKWYELIMAVKCGEVVSVSRGGKEVHVTDVAKALSKLLTAPTEKIRGQSFNCCDRYISEYAVAHLAQEICGSKAKIQGEPKSPKNQIVTEKLRALGVTFGGEPLLRQTVQELLED